MANDAERRILYHVGLRTIMLELLPTMFLTTMKAATSLVTMDTKLNHHHDDSKNTQELRSPHRSPFYYPGFILVGSVVGVPSNTYLLELFDHNNNNNMPSYHSWLLGHVVIISSPTITCVVV